MDAPRDTDREFFNEVLANTATDNHINAYIKWSAENGRLPNLELLFFCENIGRRPESRESQLIVRVYNKIVAYRKKRKTDHRKSHTKPTKPRKTFEVDLERLPKDKLCDIFQTLKDWGKIDNDADVKDWLAVFGCLVDEAHTVKPIIWTGLQTELAYFVNCLSKYCYNGNYIKVTETNFVRNGSMVKGLSKSLCNLDKDNPKFDRFKTLFK